MQCRAHPAAHRQEEPFKGIIDLVDMNADIYYDDEGKDMRVEEIPADMMDLAQEYRTKLVDAAPISTTRSWMLALEGRGEIPMRPRSGPPCVRAPSRTSLFL